MSTITKKQLIERISERTKLKRSVVRRSVQEFLDQVILELKKGNRLEFRDFGVFEVKERAARVAQNPKTLERVTVPAKRTVKFKVGRLMRDSIERGIPDREGRREAAAKEVTSARESTPLRETGHEVAGKQGLSPASEAGHKEMKPMLAAKVGA